MPLGSRHFANPALVDPTQPSQFGSAVDRTQSTLYSGVEAAARMAGYDDIQKWAQQNAQENLELADKYKPQGPQTFEGVNNVGDFIDYAGNVITNTAPQMLGMVGAGIVGGVVAGPIGAAVAAASAVAPMHLGEAYNKQIAENKYDPTRLLTATGINTAMEAVPIAKFMKVAKGLGGGTIAKAVATGVVSEAPVEAAQGAVSDWSAEITPNTDPNYWANRKEEAIAGGLVGGVMGAGAGVANKVGGLRDKVTDQSGPEYDYMRTDSETDPNAKYDEAPQYQPGLSSAEDPQSIKQQLFRDGWLHPNQMEAIENSGLNPQQVEDLLGVQQRDEDDDGSTFDNPLDQLAFNIARQYNSPLTKKDQQNLDVLDAEAEFDDELGTGSMRKDYVNRRVEMFKRKDIWDAGDEIPLNKIEDTSIFADKFNTLTKELATLTSEDFEPKFDRPVSKDELAAAHHERIMANRQGLMSNSILKQLSTKSAAFLDNWRKGPILERSQDKKGNKVLTPKIYEFDQDFLNNAVVNQVPSLTKKLQKEQYDKREAKRAIKYSGDYGTDLIGQIAYDNLTGQISDGEAFARADDVSENNGGAWLSEAYERVEEDLAKAEVYYQKQADEQAAVKQAKQDKIDKAKHQIRIDESNEGKLSPDELYDNTVKAGGTLYDTPALNDIADEIVSSQQFTNETFSDSLDNRIDVMDTVLEKANDLNLTDLQSNYIERRIKMIEANRAIGQNEITPEQQSDLESGMGASYERITDQDSSDYLEDFDKQFADYKDDEGGTSDRVAAEVKPLGDTAYQTKYLGVGAIKNDGTKWDSEIDYVLNEDATKGISGTTHGKQAKELANYKTSDTRSYKTIPISAAIKKVTENKYRYSTKGGADDEVLIHTYDDKGKNIIKTERLGDGLVLNVEERVQKEKDRIAKDIMDTRTNEGSLMKAFENAYYSGKTKETAQPEDINSDALLEYFNAIAVTPLDSAVGSGGYSLDYQDKQEFEVPLVTGNELKTDTSKLSSGFLPLKKKDPEDKEERPRQLNMVQAVRKIAKRVKDEEGYKDSTDKAIGILLTDYLDDIDLKRIKPVRKERDDSEFEANYNNSANYRTLVEIIGEMADRPSDVNEIPLKATTPKEILDALNKAYIRSEGPRGSKVITRFGTGKTNPYSFHVGDSIRSLDYNSDETDMSQSTHILSLVDYIYEHVDMDRLLTSAKYKSIVSADKVMFIKFGNALAELGVEYKWDKAESGRNFKKFDTIASKLGITEANKAKNYVESENMRIATMQTELMRQYKTKEYGPLGVTRDASNFNQAFLFESSWDDSSLQPPVKEAQFKNSATLKALQDKADRVTKILASDKGDALRKQIFDIDVAIVKRSKETNPDKERIEELKKLRVERMPRDQFDRLHAKFEQWNSKNNRDYVNDMDAEIKALEAKIAHAIKQQNDRASDKAELKDAFNLRKNNFKYKDKEVTQAKEILEKFVNKDALMSKMRNFKGLTKEEVQNATLLADTANTEQVNAAMTLMEAQNAVDKAKFIIEQSVDVEGAEARVTDRKKTILEESGEEDIGAKFEEGQYDNREDTKLKESGFGVNVNFDNIETVNEDKIDTTTFEFADNGGDSEQDGEAQDVLMTRQEEYASKGESIPVGKQAQLNVIDEYFKEFPEKDNRKEIADKAYSLSAASKKFKEDLWNKFTNGRRFSGKALEAKEEAFKTKYAKELRENKEAVTQAFKDKDEVETTFTTDMRKWNDRRDTTNVLNQETGDAGVKDKKLKIEFNDHTNTTIALKRNSNKLFLLLGKTPTKLSSRDNVHVLPFISKDTNLAEYKQQLDEAFDEIDTLRKDGLTLNLPKGGINYGPKLFTMRRNTPKLYNELAKRVNKLVDAKSYMPEIGKGFIIKSDGRNKANANDAARYMAGIATKYIGFGFITRRNQDAARAQEIPTNAKKGYEQSDTVFADVGLRPTSVKVMYDNITSALDSGATVLMHSSKFIANNSSYNIEKYMQEVLMFNGYTPVTSGNNDNVAGWVKKITPAMQRVLDVEKAKGITINFPMGYEIDPRIGRSITPEAREAVPNATKIAHLMPSGIRTGTTRSQKSFLPIGHKFTVEGIVGEYKVTGHRQVGPSHGIPWEEWSKVEGWSQDIVNTKNKTGKNKIPEAQVYDGAWQMLFERVDEGAEKAKYVKPTKVAKEYPDSKEELKLKLTKIKIPKGEKLLTEATAELALLKKDNDTVLQYISKEGGLNRKSFVKDSVDEEYFKMKPLVFGKPLFPKEGGLTEDGVAELLEQEGYFPDKPDANDILMLVSDLLVSDTMMDQSVQAEIDALENTIDKVTEVLNKMIGFETKTKAKRDVVTRARFKRQGEAEKAKAKKEKIATQRLNLKDKLNQEKEQLEEEIATYEKASNLYRSPKSNVDLVAEQQIKVDEAREKFRDETVLEDGRSVTGRKKGRKLYKKLNAQLQKEKDILSALKQKVNNKTNVLSYDYVPSTIAKKKDTQQRLNRVNKLLTKLEHNIENPKLVGSMADVWNTVKDNANTTIKTVRDTKTKIDHIQKVYDAQLKEYAPTDNVIDSLHAIIKTGDKFEKRLARRLLKYSEKTKLIKASEMPVKDLKAAGFTNAMLKTFAGATTVQSLDGYLIRPDIYINDNVRTMEPKSVILHESVHNAVMQAMAANYAREKDTTRLTELHEELIALTSFTKNYAQNNKDNNLTKQYVQSKFYGFSNEHEFIAEALSNTEFQALLKTIPYKRKTIWTEFVKSMRKFLGLSNTDESALSAVLSISDEIMAEVDKISESEGKFDIDKVNKDKPVNLKAIIGAESTLSSDKTNKSDSKLSTKVQDYIDSLTTAAQIKHAADIYKERGNDIAVEALRTRYAELRDSKPKSKKIGTLRKIISGGQTGGDLGGLVAGKALGLETGGTAPKGYKTSARDQVAAAKALKDFGVEEHNSTSYVPRTKKNVDDSDGTIAFVSPNINSVGTSKTIEYAKSGSWRYGNNTSSDTGNKPVLVLNPENSYLDNAKEIKDFVERNNIEVLNIAGHREGSFPGLSKHVVSSIKAAFTEVKSKAKSEVKSKVKSKPVNIWSSGSGNNYDLSNFANRSFTSDGQDYTSVEQAYQMAKFDYVSNPPSNSKEVKNYFLELSGRKSKNYASMLKKDGFKYNDKLWRRVSIPTMENILNDMFHSNSDAAKALLDTKDAQLTHKGPYKDDIWTDVLPMLLTKIRTRLQDGSPKPIAHALVNPLKSKSFISWKEHIKSKDLNTSLKSIAPNSNYPGLALIAERLADVINKNAVNITHIDDLSGINLSVKDKDRLLKNFIDEPNLAGIYSRRSTINNTLSDKDIIVINSRNKMADERAIIHESIHAAVIRSMKGGLLNIKGIESSKIEDLKIELDSMLDVLKINFHKDIINGNLNGADTTISEVKYALTNIDEMIAQGMSEPSVIKYMRSIPYKRTNIFTEFVRLLREILNIPKSEETMFTALLNIQSEMMDEVTDFRNRKVKYLDEVSESIEIAKTEVTDKEDATELLKIEENIDSTKDRIKNYNMSSTGEFTEFDAPNDTSLTKQETQRVADNILKGMGIKIKVVDGNGANRIAKRIGVNVDNVKNGITQGYADPNQNRDGTYNVYISPFIQGTMREEIIKHELGHIVMYATKFNTQDKGSKGIIAEYTKWLDENGHDTADLRGMLSSMKAPESAKAFIKAWAKKQGAEVGSLSDKNREYISSFDEWFADQVGKAFDRKTPTRTTVQKFFARVVKALNKMFGTNFKGANGSKTTTRTEVEKFVDRLRGTTAISDGSKEANLSTTFEESVQDADIFKKAKDTFMNVAMDKDYNLRRLANGKILAFKELADRMFKSRGDKTIDNSYWHNKLLYLAKFDTRATDIMRGATREIQAKVMKELYNEKLQDRNANSRTVKLRSLMRDLKAYMENEGIKVPTRKNYFPNIADEEYTAEHHDEFIEMMERYPREMAGIAEKWNNDVRNRDQYLHKTTDPNDLVYGKDVPQLLFDNIVRGDLMDEVKSENQQTPHVRFLKHRVIDFLKGKDRADWNNNFLQHSVTDATSTYIMQVVKRVEFSKRFGKLDSREKREYVLNAMRRGGQTSYTEAEVNRFNKEADWTNRLETLLLDAADEGATHKDIQHARDYVAAEMGTHGRDTAAWLNEKLGIPMPQSHAPINTTVQKWTSGLMSAANVWVLGLSTITSLLDPIGIAVRSGSATQSLSSVIQGIKSAVGKDRSELEILAEAVGSISDIATKEALAHGYNMTNMTPTMRKMNDKFFRLIGLEQWTKTTRLMAVDAAQGFIKRHDKNPNKHSKRFLEELGLQKGDIKYDSKGKVNVLTYEEHLNASEEVQASDKRLKSAIAEFVDTAILRPSPSQRPGWASDPHFALLFHLKSFMYSFQKTILNPLWKEAKHGNFAPLLAASAYLPAGIMVGLIKDMIKTAGDGEDDWTPNYKENWSVGQYMLDGMEKSGLTGIAQPIFDAQRSAKYGGSYAGGLLGPTLEPWDTFNGLPVPLNYAYNNLSN